MQKSFKPLSILLALAILFTSVFPAFASGPSKANEAEQQHKVQELIAAVDSFLKRAEDGTVFLATDDPDIIGITAGDLAKVEMAVEKANQVVGEGIATSHSSLKTYPDGWVSPQYDHSYYRKYWWGWVLGLDIEATQEVIRRIERGEEAADVAAFVCGEVLGYECGVILGLFNWIMSDFWGNFKRAAAPGRGVYCVVTYWGLYYCEPQ